MNEAHKMLSDGYRTQAVELRREIGDKIRSDGSMYRGEELAYLVGMAQVHATMALLQRLPA